ncbi:hypothetical protein [Dysgonomonas sp. HGC4]|uniref:hypothetical protein n=1 Tax=Dysgonomonas sp. HGC4 TaxID=1658009 RepID=UPI000A5F9849|nr:hypothetical protein [Dysgonomonas sp. HGC4]MBD8349228.1 hypothetical protein [Dysgonomonas sp. HGC4]
MKKKILFILLLLTVMFRANAQVGINTENPKATLDVSAAKTDGTTAEGIIAPKLSLQQLVVKDAKYTADQVGTIVYVNDISGTVSTKTANIKKVGYYYFDGTLWKSFDQGWGLTGNSGTDGAVNFLGTIDDKDLVFKRGNQLAGYLGGTSGNASNNTAFGVGALSLSATEIGANVAMGNNSLQNNLKGVSNTAIGHSSLRNSTGGSGNCVVGTSALIALTTGGGNTALGYKAGMGLVSGTNNIAIGGQTVLPETASNQMNIGNLLFATGLSTSTDPVSRVGIGTPSPAAKLDLNGDLIIRTAKASATNVSVVVRNNDTGLIGVLPQTHFTLVVAAGATASISTASLPYPSAGSLVITSGNQCGRFVTAMFSVVVSYPTDFSLPIVYQNSMARQVVGIPTKINSFKYQLKFPEVTSCQTEGGTTQFDFTLDTSVPGQVSITNDGDFERTYTLKISQVG